MEKVVSLYDVAVKGGRHLAPARREAPAWLAFLLVGLAVVAAVAALDLPHGYALVHLCALAVLAAAVPWHRRAGAPGLAGDAVDALALAGGGLALLAPDVAALADRAGDMSPSGAAFAWPLWSVACTAAALHPAGRPGTAAPTLPAWRLGGFATLALLLLASAYAAPAPARTAGLLTAAVVSLLLVVRLGLLAREAERRGAELRRTTTQRTALERELRHRATHDPLTGLANRTGLVARLDTLLARPDGARAGSLLLLDLDGFAEINDTQGHPTGDDVLIEVGRRLRATLPAADLVAYAGGDEFAVVCGPDADGLDEGRRALARLREPYRVGEGEVHVTASAGMLDLAGADSSAEALRDADLALYAAKGAGRNRVATFHPELRADLVRHSHLAAGLRRALSDDTLAVHYQPVVDLTDGRIVAVEALARWTTEGGEAVPPTQFIPIAEGTGLIIPIGAWVLARACADARPWCEEYGIALTVNVSGHQLRDPGFAEMVVSALDSADLSPHALVLELTESTLITHLEATTALDALRKQGVRVAIDDFGTGYSSLSSLVQLPVDILKIDRAFTVPAHQPMPHQWAFTRAILDLANSLHLLTIAEGVETSQQARALRTLDCPLAQGFLYSPPVPAGTMGELLAAWNPRSEPALV